METIVRLQGVKKSFGRACALDGLDLPIERGAVVGMLGLNGSGKTTAMRLMCGLSRADAGELDVLGQDPCRMTPKHHRRIGFLSEKDFPFPHFTFEQAASFAARFHPAWEVEYVHLDEIRRPNPRAHRALRRADPRRQEGRSMIRISDSGC